LSGLDEDPTTIFFRPADDDPLLPHRSTAAWTVASVALAIWES
jgi:hypothetical protein